MATTSTKDSTAKAKVPISRHPLFPATVALWFGALFGLGSLAVRPSLLESVVLSLHLDLLIPAAAPPLGATSRILLSAGLALIGILLGATLARRIARPKPVVHERNRSAIPVRARDAHPDAPARRPVSVRDEIEDSEPAGPVVPSGRRRALTVDETPPPSYAHEFAPLPGGEVPLLASVSEPHEPEPIPPEPNPVADELDLEAFVAPEIQAPTPDEATEMTEEPNPEPIIAEPLPQVVAPFPAEAAAVAEPDAPEQPRFAPRAFDRAEATAREEAPAAVLPMMTPPEKDVASLESHGSVVAAADPLPRAGDGMAPEAIASAELEDLSNLQLLERLGMALQNRREQAEQAAATIVEASVQPEPVSAPAAEPVAQDPPPAEPAVPERLFAMKASPMAMPSALRPISFNDEDDEDDGAVQLPPRRIVFPSFAAAQEDAPASNGEAASAEPADGEAAEEDADVLAEGYSSLLDLSRPAAARPSFVRVEEPEPEHAAVEPVVVFPGQAARVEAREPEAPSPTAIGEALRRFDKPASAAGPGSTFSATAAAPTQSPEETERALRAALATLQRMSGA